MQLRRDTYLSQANATGRPIFVQPDNAKCWQKLHNHSQTYTLLLENLHMYVSVLLYFATLIQPVKLVPGEKEDKKPCTQSRTRSTSFTNRWMNLCAE